MEPVETGRFRDRAHAGRMPAERLRDYAGRDDVIVLALPRGGVPVAYEIARALDAPLDVFVVRKLGAPGIDAERYYRATFRGGVDGWNVRDGHMAETLDALVAHLERTSGPAKVVVWAHNSHLGDARATELGQAGELNLGQLVRERHGDESLVVGFTTYAGTVTAASDWGGPAERKRVRRALPGSWEELFHGSGPPRFLLSSPPPGRRLERAIGVVYRPETERISHYFHARLADQFDAVIHIDETHALEPLEHSVQWEAGELPETYPWGV